MLTWLATGLILAQGKLEKKDVIAGKGDVAKNFDVVEVEYVGKLTDGKEFDRSKDKPFRFMLGVGQVIKGWDLGVIGMKIGGKRTLRIPASLGYGAVGAPPDIPANATLLFEVTLRKVERATVKTLKAGSGAAVKVGETVQVHYKGTLADGKEFDSSYKSGRPLPVRVGTGSVIPGFDQGLIGIRKGEKRRIQISSSLGYGSRGAGGVIPPNADLVFEIECVSIG
jgi:FKBP-type peptidyl-prolyl cis-trans isomerase